MPFALVNSRPTVDGRRKIHTIGGTADACAAARERMGLSRSVTKIVVVEDLSAWGPWRRTGWMPADIPLVTAAKGKGGPPRAPQRDGLAGRIGAFARAARLAAGLTVEQAAGRAGVKPSTWNRIESGRVLGIMTEQVEAIERGTGRSILVEELMNATKQPEGKTP